MEFDTDVLIVGGGPTGLMLACQLASFGVSFQIMDAKADRSQESRAFGIQAKSMEIFQKLGVVAEFLKHAQPASTAEIIINGQRRLRLNLDKIKLKNSPFPSLYFLPQSQTERILESYIEQRGYQVTRQCSLVSFSQADQYVKAIVKNEVTQETRDIYCRYIVGCDGAHSTVRHLLNIPFIGGDYRQEFILADAKVSWPNHNPAQVMVFIDNQGIFLHLPLGKDCTRIMVTSPIRPPTTKTPLTLEEIETIAQTITHVPIQLSNGIWMTRFSLHHRAVKQYQQGRAFIAGDAAHIHSPVGAQGMNTGLQDVTNLAWKLAAVLKINASPELLTTYELEREIIGKKLLTTTDRFFKLFSSPNRFLTTIRPLVLSGLLTVVAKSARLQKRLFWFASQLGIYYPQHKFTYEKTVAAHRKFLSAPKAGYRAPDSPLGTTTFFKLLKESFCSVFIFYTSQENKSLLDTEKLRQIEKTYHPWLKIHIVTLSSATKTAFDLYGVSDAAIYVIRPDGYIGFRENKINIDNLLNYMKQLLGEHTSGK